MPLRPPGRIPDFRSLQRANLRRSWAAAGFLWLLAGLIGGGLGWLTGLAAGQVEPLRGAVFGVGCGIFLGLIASVVAFVRSESTTLTMLRAVDPPPEVARQIHNILDELILAAGVRRPSIHYIDDAFPNACAVGLHDHPGHICVTRGLVEQLNRDQLKAVVAHELAHLKHEDAVFSTMTATLFGKIYFMKELSRDLIEVGVWGARHDARTRVGRHGRRVPANVFIGFAAWFLFATLSVIAYMVVLSASRSREWMADMAAIEMTRNPGALAEALRQISDSDRTMWTASRGVQHLYFANPFRGGASEWALFSTHPPIEARIALLESMAGHRTRRGN